MTIVATLLVGGTMAYLTATTAEKSNVFSFRNDITAVLEEPSWSDEAAKNLLPNAVVPKDPEIKNSSSTDELVAMKVVFYKGSGASKTLLTQTEYEWLMKAITIQYDTGEKNDDGSVKYANGVNPKWAEIKDTTTPTQYWYYKDVLAGGNPAESTTWSKTDSIFDQVKINNNDTTVMKQLRDWNGFTIYVTGAAVQANVFATSTTTGEGSDAKTTWTLSTDSTVLKTMKDDFVGLLDGTVAANQGSSIEDGKTDGTTEGGTTEGGTSEGETTEGGTSDAGGVDEGVGA
jgi:hypothetical protein